MNPKRQAKILEMLNKENSVKYDTLSVSNRPNNKLFTKDGKKKRVSKIPPITIPATMKRKHKKSVGGIPKAEDFAATLMKAPTFKKSEKDKKMHIKMASMKPGKSGGQYKMRKIRDNNTQSSKMDTEFAGQYVDKMDNGSKNLGNIKFTDKKLEPTVITHKTSKRRNVKVSMKGRKQLRTSVPPIDNKMKKMQMPIDAPKIPKWETTDTGKTIRENVVVKVNGNTKFRAPFISESALKTAVREYRKYGYHVGVTESTFSAWQKNKTFRDLVAGSVDAFYNKAYNTSARLYESARNKFFDMYVGQYNTLYESKLDFGHTMTEAVNNIMRNFERVYIKSLSDYDGIARIQIGESTYDIDATSLAHGTKMALKNITEEIQHEYGFSTKIIHIFIDGKKYVG